MNLKHFINSFIIFFFIITLYSCKSEIENKLYFMGDSIVAGWDVSYYFPTSNSLNLGIDGSKITDLKEINIDFDKNSTIVFLIGTNNIATQSLVDTLTNTYIVDLVDNYLSIVENIEARNKIIISILPRRVKTKNDLVNYNIDLVNKVLAHQIKLLPNVTFLNISNDFKDIEGELDYNYSVDGVHINALGYGLLSSKLSDAL